jgi:hypothetical protein
LEAVEFAPDSLPAVGTPVEVEAQAAAARRLLAGRIGRKLRNRIITVVLPLREITAAAALDPGGDSYPPALARWHASNARICQGSIALPVRANRAGIGPVAAVR